MDDSRPNAAAASWLRHARRIGVAIAGGLVLLVGVAMVVLPGPAMLVIPVGLSILATEFHWAKKLLHRLKDSAHRVSARWKSRRAAQAT